MDRPPTFVQRWGARLNRWGGRAVYLPVGVLTGALSIVSLRAAASAVVTRDWIPALLLVVSGVLCGAMALYALSPRRRLTDLDP